MAKRTVSVAYEDPRFSKREALYWSQVRNALDAMGAPNSGELLHNSKAYVDGVFKAGLPALETAAVIWHKHCQAAGTSTVPCVAEDREQLVAADPWVLVEPGFWEWKTTKYPPGGYAIAQLPRKKGFELGRWDSKIGRVSFRAIAVYPSLESAQVGAAVYAQQPGGMEQGATAAAAAASECPCEVEESRAVCPPNVAGEKKKISHTELPAVALSKISKAQRSYIDEFTFYDIGDGRYLAFYGHDTSPIAVWDGSSWSHPRKGFLSESVSEANDSAPSCVPFTRLERNNEAFQACQRIAAGPLETDRDMFRLLSAQLGKEDQEVFVVVGLDLHRNLRSYTEVARGQRDRVAVDVADVIRAVIADGPHGFVVAHNHPSGKANPSPKDKELTEHIRRAAAVACPSVVFLDHIVVGQGEYYCFADKKLKRV
jgi:RadC-like JAB domain-containing protein